MYGELDGFDFDDVGDSVEWFKASEEDWEIAKFYEEIKEIQS